LYQQILIEGDNKFTVEKHTVQYPFMGFFLSPFIVGRFSPKMDKTIYFAQKKGLQIVSLFSFMSCS